MLVNCTILVSRENNSKCVNGAICPFWLLKFIPLFTNLRNLRSIRTMTYGCQTWTLTKDINNKIVVSQRKMERKNVRNKTD